MSSTVHAAPRQTSVPVGRLGNDINIVVSSVNYTTTTPYWTDHIDETCVFYPYGHSEVRGSYDDHDAIVAELRGLPVYGCECCGSGMHDVSRCPHKRVTG